MKLIESKAEYIPQEEGLEGIYKMIELAGRTAYHSQDKITPTSAKDFVDRMIKSKHGAALEHGTVYLKFKDLADNDVVRYIENHYSAVGKELCVSSNLRVLQENNWLDDLQYLCSPTEFHEKRYTMRFTCSRAIAQELTRHRTFSFLMESQRYINYSKERHGGEITFIIPSWLDCKEMRVKNGNSGIYILTDGVTIGEINKGKPFIHYLAAQEEMYFKLLQQGKQPQQARDVLPNATKTELIMTGFASDWRYLLDIRYYAKTGKPHPDMENLMLKAQEVMQEVDIWEDIMSKPSKFKE